MSPSISSGPRQRNRAPGPPPTSTPSPAPDLSVIIPCYNAADTLRAQLRALAAQSCARGWEVIVADNGSTDDLPAVIADARTALPALRLVDASDLQGVSHARNVGVAHARAEYLLFCDADDVVGENWLTGMAEALDRHEFVAGRFDFTRLNDPAAQGGREAVQQTGLIDRDYLPYAGGGNMGIRRSVFRRVGGFDEQLPCLEDVDFCWRVQEQGTPLTFAPEALLHVRVRPTSLGGFRQARNYATYYVLVRERHGVPTFARARVWSMLRGGVPKHLRAALTIRSSSDLYTWLWEVGWFLGLLRGLRRARTAEFSSVKGTPRPGRTEPASRAGPTG